MSLYPFNLFPLFYEYILTLLELKFLTTDKLLPALRVAIKKKKDMISCCTFKESKTLSQLVPPTMTGPVAPGLNMNMNVLLSAMKSIWFSRLMCKLSDSIFGVMLKKIMYVHEKNKYKSMKRQIFMTIFNSDVQITDYLSFTVTLALQKCHLRLYTMFLSTSLT